MQAPPQQPAALAGAAARGLPLGENLLVPQNLKNNHEVMNFK